MAGIGHRRSVSDHRVVGSARFRSTPTAAISVGYPHHGRSHANSHAVADANPHAESDGHTEPDTDATDSVAHADGHWFSESHSGANGVADVASFTADAWTRRAY